MSGSAFGLTTKALQRVVRCIRDFAAQSKTPVPVALVPSAKQIAQLIDAVHWASVMPDEGRFPRFAVSFGPPDPPGAPVRVRRMKLTPSNLASLAPAAVRDLCQIGVSSRDGRLQIWGLYVGPTTRVVVRALDPARVAVALGPETLAVIEHSTAHDLVNWDPVVRRWHGVGPGYFARMLSGFFTTNISDEHARAALGALLALLAYAIRAQGHGGTALLVRPRAKRWIGKGRLGWRHVGLSHTLDALTRQLDRKLPPWEAINASAVGPFFIKKRMIEIHPAVRDAVTAIATLTGVDGALALDERLRLLDFGATIRQPKGDEPRFDVKHSSVVTAPTLENLDLRTLKGTRRQTAALFVRNNYDSLALVVSHDGPVRLVGWGRDKAGKDFALLMDSIELMLD